MTTQEYIDEGVKLLMEKGPQVILAIVVLVVGLFIIKKLGKVTAKVMEKKNTDPSLRSFLLSMLSIVLKVLLLVSVADMVGIKTTSFIAILGAAGLAVGLALQGTLANFAGGVLILIFKPFKVGDLIEAQGQLGNVKEIQIFITTLTTPENKTAIIPNGILSNGNILNYTTEGKIRVDLHFGIAYDADIKAARKALVEVMEKHPKVLQDPAPFVGLGELGDSAMKLAVRPFAKPEDYWDVYFDIYEQGKAALTQANVQIPFPQIDVHMKS